MILRRDRDRPFDVVAVVSPDARSVPIPDAPSPGGRLRFILRSALPGPPQRDLATTDELLALARRPAAGDPRRRPSSGSPTPSSRGSAWRRSTPAAPALEAFATTHTPSAEAVTGNV